MSILDETPPNPAELAIIRAQEYWQEATASKERRDQRRIVELDAAAETLGFTMCKYFVQSYRGLSVPVSWDRDQPVSITDFMGITFEGTFVTYSNVEVGRIIGGHSVRALCLCFYEVTPLTFAEPLPDDHLLYVPVLAVESMDAQAA